MKISIILGDITQLDVDAIVNAANNSLLGGGGVDGAIHRAAGPELLEACRALKGCQTGEAKITPGFRLKAKWVIHTVGPVWSGGTSGEDELLASCYRNCFRIAREHSLKTIAFPAISTGVFGFPLERATEIAFSEAQQEQSQPNSPEEVIFVCFDEAALKVYQSVAQRHSIPF